MRAKLVKYNYLRNGEHFQFCTELKDLAAAAGAETLGINSQFNAFLASYGEEDIALKKIVKSATTAGIEAADRARDITFMGLAGTCKAARYHYDPATAEAAERLNVVLDTYGNLAIKPLNEETAGIYNLLQDLNGGYAGDVQTVGLSGWVIKLEADNKAFDALVKERNNENSAKSHLKMKECRAETDKIYSEIIERINALIVVNGEAAYADFVSKLNEFTDKYNNAVARRQGRAGKHHNQNSTNNTENQQ